jgi:uncharacterized protein
MEIRSHQSIHEFLTCELLLTTSCNMSCTYCIARDLGLETMQTDCGKSAIDLFISLSEGAKALEFTFTGGEPLLCYTTLKYLTKYANNRANEAGFNTTFVLKTNGTLLSGQIVNFLKSFDFKVVLSIDGLPNSHDKFRKGKKGELTQKKVALNLENLFKKGVSCVASLTIHPSQTHKILDNIIYLHDLGAKHIDIGPVYGTVNWTQNDISDLTLSIQRVAEYIRATNKTNFLEVGPLYKESEHVGGVLSDSWGCKAGATNLAFLPNGQITGCSALSMLVPKFSNLILGDVRTGINYYAVNLFLRDSQAQIENRYLCKKCETATNCTGGCLAINLAVNEQPFLPPSFYCQTISSIGSAWKLAWEEDKIECQKEMYI